MSFIGLSNSFPKLPNLPFILLKKFFLKVKVVQSIWKTKLQLDSSSRIKIKTQSYTHTHYFFKTRITSLLVKNKQNGKKIIFIVQILANMEFNCHFLYVGGFY